MRGTIIAAALATLLVPALAAGQQPVSSFDQLNNVLKTGDKVRVTDSDGREASGRVLALDAGSITLDEADGKRFPADRVRLVQRLKASKLLGCLIGTGAGIAGGFIFAEAAETGEEALGGYIFPFIGAGAGTLIGAFMHRAHDVYRAPSGGTNRLTLAPVLTPRAKGLALSWTF